MVAELQDSMPCRSHYDAGQDAEPQIAINDSGYFALDAVSGQQDPDDVDFNEAPSTSRVAIAGSRGVDGRRPAPPRLVRGRVG